MSDIVEFLKEQKVKETGAFSKGVNRGLNIAISAIKNPEICPPIEQHALSAGCDYCQEDSGGYRRMFGAFSIANPYHGNKWTLNTGHCKPQQIFFCPMCGKTLSQPPKGDE